MRPLDCPSESAEKEIEKLKKKTGGLIIVDMHAEGTSEKQALAGFWMAGECCSGHHIPCPDGDERS